MDSPMKKSLLKISLIIFCIFSFQTAKAQWEACNDGLTGYNSYLILCFDDYLFTGCLGYGVYVSSDNGDSWSELNNGIDIDIIKMIRKQSKIFAGSYITGMYVTEDTGKSWSEINNGLGAHLRIISLAANGTHIFAGIENFGLFSSDNDGKYWGKVDLGNENYLEDVQCITAKDTNIYIGLRKGLYISDDNSKTWVKSDSGLSNKDIRNILLYKNIMFVGTGGSGIFQSTDGGKFWTAANSGLENSYIRTLIAINDKLLAGTIEGVYISDIKNISWKQRNQGLNYLSIESSDFNKDYVFISGEGLKVYRQKFNDLFSHIPEESPVSIGYSLSISPNPATDFIEISGINQRVNGANDIHIYNSLGEMVLNLTSALSEGERAKINVSGLLPGLYFVRIGDKVSKFVKI